MASNTSIVAAGWLFGVLSLAAGIGMIIAPNWEQGAILGDSLSAMDGQGRTRGLWYECTTIPSGQAICIKLGIIIGGAPAHVVAARSILIVVTLIGLFAAFILLGSFKCIDLGPDDYEGQRKYARVAGFCFLLNGALTIASGVWYYVAVQQQAKFIPLSNFSRKTPPWTTGQAVQITLAAGLLWVISAVLVICFTQNNVDQRDDYKWKRSSAAKQEYV